jgi:hypothetical protein
MTWKEEIKKEFEFQKLRPIMREEEFRYALDSINLAVRYYKEKAQNTEETKQLVMLLEEALNQGRILNDKVNDAKRFYKENRKKISKDYT